MDKFLTLTENERFNLLTQKHIFAPQRQIELLYFIYNNSTWKKRNTLCRKISSNLLIFDWLDELKRWSMSEDVNKRLFSGKLFYFIRKKYVEKYIGINEVPQTDEISEPKEDEIKKQKTDEIFSRLIDIIRNIQSDKSDDVLYTFSRSLAVLSMEDNKVFSFWKELLTGGNVKQEYLALVGMGEFFQSHNEELKIYTEALKSYFEDPDRDNGFLVFKNALSLKINDPSVLCLSLAPFHIYAPELADKVVQRDFSVRTCAFNILKSFENSLIYLYQFNKSERMEKSLLVYDRFQQLEAKYFIPEVKLLKLSDKGEDYDFSGLFASVYGEFCYIGIHKAYQHICDILEFDIPECFKFEIICLLMKINFQCNNNFCFSLEKILENFSKNINSQSPYLYLLYHFFSIKKYIGSVKIFDELYCLIRDFKVSVNQYFYDIENQYFYTDTYQSVIRPMWLIAGNGYIQEFSDLLTVLPYFYEENTCFIDKIKGIFMRDNFELIKKKLCYILSLNEKPELQKASLEILQKICTLTEIVPLLCPLLKTARGDVIEKIGEIYGSFFDKLIADKEENKVLHYLKEISFHGAGGDLYNIISLKSKSHWLSDIIKTFAGFHRTSCSFKDDSSDFIISKFLGDIVSKKELDQHGKFKQDYRDLYKLFNFKSIKDISSSLEPIKRLDKYIIFNSDDRFIEEFNNCFDSFRKNVLYTSSINCQSLLSCKNMETILFKIEGDCEKLLDFLSIRGYYYFDKTVLLILERILYLWNRRVISKLLYHLKNLRDEFSRKEPLCIYNEYLSLKNSNLLENSRLKDLEWLILTNLIESSPKTDDMALELIKIVRELEKASARKDKVFINFYCSFLKLRSNKLINYLSPIMSEYLMALHRDKNYSGIMEFIYILLEHDAGRETFALIGREFSDKNVPLLKNLMEKYSKIIDENFKIEDIYGLLSSLKEFRKTFSCNIDRIDTYDVFLDLIKGSYSLKDLRGVIKKLNERGNLQHSLYECLEKNGFSLIESSLYTNSEYKSIIENKQKSINEKLWISIIQILEDFNSELSHLFLCDFMDIQERIGHFKALLDYLTRLKEHVNEIKDPVARNMLKLFIERLSVRKEEEIEPDVTFSISKLIDRWTTFYKLLKSDHVDELKVKYYYKKDIFNYLQISETDLKEFKNYILRYYYKKLDFNSAIYFEYTDRVVEKGGKKSNLLPEYQSNLPLFTIISGIFSFLFLFLPGILSLINVPSGNTLQVMFFSILTISVIAPSVWLFLYFIRRLYFNIIPLIFPKLLLSLFFGLIICLLNDKILTFAFTIEDSVFIIFSVTVFFITFLTVILSQIKSGKGSEHIIVKTLGLIFLAFTESFIISFIISTLIIFAFKNSVVFQGISGNIPFLFGLFPRECSLSAFHGTPLIYPSIVYTLTFIGLLFSNLPYIFTEERRR